MRVNRRQRGAILILFGLSLIVLLAFAFVALDSATGNLRQAQLQDAADAAALAGARALIVDGNNNGVIDSADNPAVILRANDIFNSNIPAGIPPANLSTDVIIDRNTLRVTVNATYTDVAGTVNEIDIIRVSATAELTVLPTEMAFSLDVTGSMLCPPGLTFNDGDDCFFPLVATRKIDGVLSAFNLFATTIEEFPGTLAEDNLYISIVPFNHRVNIGTNNVGFLSGLSPPAGSPPTATWDGCVFARSGGNDVNDVSPSDARFEPIFDPEEYCKQDCGFCFAINRTPGAEPPALGTPLLGYCDPIAYARIFTDNDASGTVVPPPCDDSFYNPIGCRPVPSTCPPELIGPPPTPFLPAQTVPSNASQGCGMPPVTIGYIARYPNQSPYVCYVRGKWHCPQPLDPLRRFRDLTAAGWTSRVAGKLVTLGDGNYNERLFNPIPGLTDQMLFGNQCINWNVAADAFPDTSWTYVGPYGLTHINLGVIWGLRTLSPNFSFSGQIDPTSPYRIDNPRDARRKILVLMTDGVNEYKDTLFDWLPTHVGSAYEGRGNPNKPELDAKTAAACNFAKSKGVEVYTIAFDTALTPLLRDCASSEFDAFAATDIDGLRRAFREIADRIFSVRLVE